MVVIHCLQASALIWQFQICIDHPILIHLILRNIELHCLTNYILLLFSTLYFAIGQFPRYVLKVEP